MKFTFGNKSMGTAGMLISILSLAMALVGPAQAAFVHPGITQSRAELDFMKAKILAGEEPWKGAWERLRAASYSSLTFQPKAFAHVIRGPYGNPKIGADELQASANASHSHALQWYVTGNPAHARKVIEIFNAWAPVLQDFQHNDAKLLAGWTGYSFCNAAEILRVTDSGWEQTDIDKFKKMLLEVYYPLLKNFFPEANGNWDAAIMSTLLAIGIFCDDPAIFDRAVNHFIRGPLNGGITHYVYPSGQCQESTRDHPHTQLGLDWMAKTARIAWTQGMDLFGVADNRLALGFEYTAKYLAGEEVPAENSISRRDRLADIYLTVYQHYHFDKGLSMPYTELAVNKTMDRATLSLLTMYRGPLANPPARREAPKPSTIAAQGGALREASAQVPSAVVLVAPGESIQAALDSAKGKGGWVVLKKGVHTLPAALQIPSSITLAGEGADTVLWMNGKVTGPAIINGDKELHDVTLRDFVIEGATTGSLPSDPNAARRVRARPAAPARGGIQLTPGEGKKISRLRLEHLTVRNGTTTGLSLENATDIIIKGCSFTDNGNLSGGSVKHHNVWLKSVERCEVADSRLNNSPAGCGMQMLACRDITIAGNEIARNALRGVHASNVHDLRLRDNLVEGNETGGIMFDKDVDVCKRIEVSQNLARNNGGYGMEIRHVTEGIVQGNRLADNAPAEEIKMISCQNIKR